jgi:hypothetical protein
VLNRMCGLKAFIQRFMQLNENLRILWSSTAYTCRRLQIPTLDTWMVSTVSLIFA